MAFDAEQLDVAEARRAKLGLQLGGMMEVGGREVVDAAGVVDVAAVDQIAVAY
jgi:hypothetical protein